MMPCPCCGRGDVFGEIEDPAPLLSLPGEGWRPLSHGDLEADAADYQRSRPTPADAGEVPTARDLFEIMRPCFHYAKRGTPDGGAFERSETGRLLMNGCEKLAARVSPLQVTNCLETGNGSKSFREGVEAAAKVADELSNVPAVGSTPADKFHNRIERTMARTIAAAIRALSSGEG